MLVPKMMMIRFWLTNDGVFGQSTDIYVSGFEFTWKCFPPIIPSLTPRMEKSVSSDGTSIFRPRTFFLVHPVRDELVSSRVQPPPSDVKSQ